MLMGEVMDSEVFERYYCDTALRRRVRRLAARYHRSYYDLLAFGGYYDAEEIEAELWARMAESLSYPANVDLFFREVVNDIHNVVRDAKRVQGWRDPMVYAMGDGEGNQETEEEVIDRLYYGADHG